MNREAVIKAAYFAVLAVGDEPSRRTVQAMCKRICGKAVQTRDVLSFLRDFRDPVPLQYQQRTEPVPPFALKLVDPVPPQDQQRTRSRAPHKELYQQTDLPIDQDQSGQSENAKSKQQPWVIELREAARLIEDIPLRNLTLEERSVCGRYHAFRFSNCTKSENRNVIAGAKAAAAFAKMADSEIFGDFTVRDYVDHGAIYRRDFMRGAPFHDPFLIRAVVEARAKDTRGRR